MLEENTEQAKVSYSRYTELFASIVQKGNESTIFTQIFTGSWMNGANENHWVPTYLRKHEERNTVVT